VSALRRLRIDRRTANTQPTATAIAKISHWPA
jgi:hypothetical protein